MDFVAAHPSTSTQAYRPDPVRRSATPGSRPGRRAILWTSLILFVIVPAGCFGLLLLGPTRAT